MKSSILKSRCGWPARPRVSRGHLLGPRQSWLRGDRCARVDRYLGGSRRFVASEADPHTGLSVRVLTNHATLAAAEAACDQAVP